MSDLYDKDTYTWALQQADALRRRSANEVDWENVAEEIESVGKTEARELENRYIVLLTHLLKWLYQPGMRSRSWEASIRVASIMGEMQDNDRKRGEMAARINGANVQIIIIPINLTNTKLRIKARKGIFPRIAVAQEVYAKIINQLE